MELDFDHCEAKQVNQLFVIDQKPSVTHLRQCKDNQKSYRVLKIWNLNQINDNIKRGLDWLRITDYSRTSISERCLTIQGQTYIYETHHCFESLPVFSD